MSCLFDSLSRFFKSKTSHQIRQEICDYLAMNKPVIDGLDTNVILNLDGPGYIDKMRRSYVWGSAIEIQAACSIWRLKVVVHDIRAEIPRGFKGKPSSRFVEFLPVNGVAPKHEIHLSWNGGHYEPMYKRQLL